MSEVFHETTEDGYVTVIDPSRGIGLVCEPPFPKRTCRCCRGIAVWRVSMLLLRIDEPKTHEFTTDFGMN